MRVLTIVLLLAVLAAPLPVQAAPPQAVLESLDHAVVLISVTLESGGRVIRGSGSGIILDPEGMILTANHVVSRAREISVTLWTGETLPARVAGIDPLFDIALVQVEARESLPVARLGGSDGLTPGEVLTALGRASRRQAGPTSGTFLDVDLETRPGVPYLRTLAPVWPGDSGGPLVNDRGEVVGVIVAITRDGAMSIAVAIDAVKAQLADLRRGSVRHPWLGITGTTITDQIVGELGLAVRSGVLVFEVLPGGPAAQAGLRGGAAAEGSDLPRGGDIIISVDGQAVPSFGALAAYVLSRRIGDAVTLQFVRDGQVHTTTLVLGERPNV